MMPGGDQGGNQGRDQGRAPGQELGPTITDIQIVLGQHCLDQGGIERTQAVEWFRSAARGGDGRAFNMLGRCFENGWGVEADLARAIAYYRKAADLGDGWALFNLADLHARGQGVPRDDGQAYVLYQAAARKGVLKALNMLGLFQECGRGVPADRDRAEEYFRAAAERGDCWGQFNHARLMLQSGDVKAALPWLRRALSSGFPDFFQHMAAALAGQDDPRLRAIAAQARMKGEASS